MQIFYNFENINKIMNLRLRYIIILAVCIILCNQFFHLYILYKEQENHYTHQQNNLISAVLCEFNIKCSNNDIVSYDAQENQLIYQIKNQIKTFQLSKENNIKKILEQIDYDVRSPQLWTLKTFYTYLQTKQDSTRMKNLSMQFVIQDSSGQIKESYPEKLTSLPSSPEYREPLGFISGDIIYATYSYPLIVFLQTATWEIILTIIISALFILCIVNLYQTIRNEKKRGKYRELFIDNLVHDLKRPVANQIKLCYLLRETPPENQTSLLEQSQEQLNEMLQSINRMLLQSTDAHGLCLNIRDLNLQETLEALTQKERWNTQADKKVDIQVDFRSANPVIRGDVHFLFAVFQNFIDNALKYSGDQVNIQIKCTDPDAQQVFISFKDNGFGISSKNLSHVFERFNRGDHQGNRAIKGNGQGLHYARTVILAHGGKINIESEEGKGTTIFVTLPRKANIKNRYKH